MSENTHWPPGSLEESLTTLARSTTTSVWLVGGAVRDALLSRPVADLDLLVEGDPGPFLEALAIEAGTKPVLFDRKFPPTTRIRAGGRHVDISGCGKGDITVDLARRDFSINAMASPLEAGPPTSASVLDPHGGLDDLTAGRIRLVSPGGLDEDPLRMLRGIRLCTVLDGFETDDDFLQETRKRAGTIATVATERIRAEMEIILRGASAGAGLRLMAEADLLFPVFPPLGPLSGLEQGSWHLHDVLEHTLRVVSVSDRLKQGHGGLGIGPLGQDDSLVLGWAALLHDTGKADTRSTDGGGIHFHGHEQISAAIAESLLSHMKVPTARTRRVVRLVENHLRLSSLASAARVTERAIRRLVHHLEDDLPLLCLLAVADREGAGAGPPGQIEAIVKIGREALETKDSRGDELIGPKPLLSGKEIMDLLHLEPGPRVGSISRWLIRLQVDGRISHRDDAVALLESLPPSRIPPSDPDQ